MFGIQLCPIYYELRMQTLLEAELHRQTRLKSELQVKFDAQRVQNEYDEIIYQYENMDRNLLIKYLLYKIDIKDWDGVQIAINDLKNLKEK